MGETEIPVIHLEKTVASTGLTPTRVLVYSGQFNEQLIYVIQQEKVEKKVLHRRRQKKIMAFTRSFLEVSRSMLLNIKIYGLLVSASRAEIVARALLGRG